MIAIDKRSATAADTKLDFASDVLKWINPPQQDYDKLAEWAERFLDDPDPQLRALAIFFYRFGCGYARWQITYDYPRIHEYFYGAFLQAVSGPPIPPDLRRDARAVCPGYDRLYLVREFPDHERSAGIARALSR